MAILETANALLAQLEVPCSEPVNAVEVIEVIPVIVVANVKLSVPSTAKLVPAKSVNKLP